MRTRLVSWSLLPVLLSALPAWSEVSTSPAPSSAELSPVGRWRTVDERTGKTRSIIAIWEEGGRLHGKIEQPLDTPPGDPNPKCDKCPGELKDQPIAGLRFLWGLRKDGDQWSGGRVLDPENGKTYRCAVALEDGGRRLKIRGDVGFSLLGRTQRWQRVE